MFCAICEIPTKFAEVSAKFATKIVEICCYLIENLRKNYKICDENVLNFSGWSGGIPVSFALFDHFLLGSGCLGLFAFSSRLVSAWFFPVVFYLTDSKGAKECAVGAPPGVAGFFRRGCIGPRCRRSSAVFCRSPSALRPRHALFISFPRHRPAPCLSQVGYCDLDLRISEISPFSEMSEIS